MADHVLQSSWPRSWTVAWTRAVVIPAWRRALAVWLGAGIVAAVVFGPTGMRPHDLTRLALHDAGVGGALAVTWLLLFVPTARVIVRAEAATYLLSLPAPRWPAIAIAVVALVGLQLPWLALWIFGEGATGGAVVGAMTMVIVAIAMWRPRPGRSGSPAWRSDRAALRGIYVRALRRQASDAIVRAAGLAVLAGVAGGVIVRNNELSGSAAAVLGTSVITIVLVPGAVGVLLPLLQAHRASAWLAASLGISATARIAVLATVVTGVYALAGAIAAGAASIVIGSFGSLVPVAIGVAAGSGLATTRALVTAEASDAAASQVVIGAIVAAAIAVVAIGWLGVAGVGAVAAIALVAIATVRT